MKIEKNFLELVKLIIKPEDVPISLKQNNIGDWCIRWGGYSNVYLKGCSTSISLNLTEFIFIDTDSIINFVDTDEDGVEQARGQYPLSLVEKIVLGI